MSQSASSGPSPLLKDVNDASMFVVTGPGQTTRAASRADTEGDVSRIGQSQGLGHVWSVVQGEWCRVQATGRTGDGCETLVQLGTDWAGAEGASRHSQSCCSAAGCCSSLLCSVFMLELLYLVDPP